MNQESHLTVKSKVVAAIAGAALVPAVYIVTLLLIAILLGTGPNNVAAKSMVAGLLSLGIWVCLLVIIGVSLRRRQPGLARYLVVGAFLGMAAFVALPFLELALGVSIFP